jgi:hypothetical protein
METYRQYDLQRVMLTHFDTDSSREEFHPGTEEPQVREQMMRDGWILLKSGGNKEGDELHFARPRA